VIRVLYLFLGGCIICSAQIRFHNGEKEYACKYDIFCECCGKNIYKNDSHSLSMAEAMKILPDAIFCHKFWAVLGDKEITLYLFDRHFEVMGIKKCTEATRNHDNQNDCCIGNNQQILDALSPHKSYEDCMKDMFNIMDAFFTILVIGVCPGADKQDPLPTYYISTQKSPNLCRKSV
jgi:hypothetical protein